MPSTQDILNQTLPVDVSLFQGALVIKCKKRLALLTPDNEEKVQRVQDLAAKVKAINEDTALTPEQKDSQVKAIEQNPRAEVTDMIVMMVKEWDWEAGAGGNGAVALTSEGIEKEAIPLEILMEIFTQVSSAELVPKAPSKP